MKKILLLLIMGFVGMHGSAQSSDYFVITWTPTKNVPIEIPITGDGYDYEVNWNYAKDKPGTWESGSPNTHTYSNGKLATIAIRGVFPRIYFNNTGDKLRIKSIEQWGTNSWQSMNGAFKGCSQLVNNATDAPDLSDVSDMESMFEGASEFNGNIGSWNVNKVTNMTNMFMGATLSTTNYDALLVGWNNPMLKSEVKFHGGNSKYCGGEAAKTIMSLAPLSWMITDGGKECPDITDYFITTWQTTMVNETINIPTFPGETYSYTVDWGDGKIDYGVTPIELTPYIPKIDGPPKVVAVPATYGNSHIYEMPGTYRVKIFGTFPRIYFNELFLKKDGTNGVLTEVEVEAMTTELNSKKIKSIEHWGNNSWKSMENAFRGCVNLIGSGNDAPDLSLVTDMAGMFAHAWKFTGVGNIGDWDVSNVKDMNGLFGSAKVFNQEIGLWKVGKVENMKLMFYGSLFNQYIGLWDVSSVINMESMFRATTEFNQDLGFNQNIEGWNVSSVVNMNSMFSGNKKFNQDIGGWNVSNVTTMISMFAGAILFEQDIGDWNVSKVKSMDNMFSGKDTGLSIANYDALLMGWNSRPLQSGVTFSGGESQYCEGTADRQEMMNVLGWDIIDFGRDCSAKCSDKIEDITTWNGLVHKWSKGHPNDGAEGISVVFAEDYEIGLNETIAGCHVVIDNNATVTVSEGAVIQADYDLEIKNGHLIFLSGPAGSDPEVIRNGSLGTMSRGEGAIGADRANVTVHKYMSKYRSYRIVSPSVTTSTSIHTNWQEGKNNRSSVNRGSEDPKFGMHITGGGDWEQNVVNGFDYSKGNASIYTLGQDANGAESYNALANTNINTLTAGKSYMLYVRGDRTVNRLYKGWEASTTLLRAKGELAIGSQFQDFIITPAPKVGEEAGSVFVMFGNPYQSAVNMVNVLEASINVNPYFYYLYDPTKGISKSDEGLGAFVTVDLTPPLEGEESENEVLEEFKYLQPGQGALALVENTATKDVKIVFKEGFKVPERTFGASRSAKRNTVTTDLVLKGQLYTQANYTSGGNRHDGFVIRFAESNDNARTAHDAVKPLNFAENLGVEHNGIYLSIERRALPEDGEVLKLFTNGYKHTDYVLKMILSELAEVPIYLDDHYTGESVVLEQGAIAHAFKINKSDAKSSASDRFSLRVSKTLSVGDNELLSGPTFYPNPAKNKLHLTNAKNLKLESASFYDLTGRLIKKVDLKGTVSKMTLDVSMLSSATYLVVIVGENGKTSKLLIKE